MRLFDVGGLVAIAGMGFTLAVAVARNGLALARLEPRRPSAPRAHAGIAEG
jgi:hypothetical protein